jgi:argininosuccinate lyase
MEDTGRIKESLTPTARRILFGETADQSIDTELNYATQVDYAHLLSLAACGIVDRTRAASVLQEIQRLRAAEFLPLRGLPARRGLFLLYEDYLIEKLGAETGGILQTARSRNDLNATMLRLRLRIPYLRLLGEALRLQAVLLRRADRFATVVMPAYTHYQAAVPVTYGHYLAGIAQAVSRDIAELFFAGKEMQVCPLGAGAVGGTSWPLDTARTAAWLGFARPGANSFDAVGSRDLILRLLSAAAILGVTLSRLAADLLLWSTAEFGFLSFPDKLVGSSSMMPQKRNPFLLEHVQGRSTSALGAFVGAASAMQAKPFTNSIAVGTDAVSHVWGALQKTTEATTLARLVVAGSKPEAEAMLRRAEQGYTQATELANRLAKSGRISFRTAHKEAGSIIREALENGGESLLEAARRHWENEPQISLEGLDPESVARAALYGGGPGPVAQESSLRELRADWRRKRARRRSQAQKWRTAEQSLYAAVAEYCRATQESETLSGDRCRPGNREKSRVPAPA